jgi:hypothetical protein
VEKLAAGFPGTFPTSRHIQGDCTAGLFSCKVPLDAARSRLLDVGVEVGTKADRDGRVT